MAQRKKHAEEHENEERWLLTYADLITLLMAFFMIMYALSRIDTNKFKSMAVSLTSVFPTSGHPAQIPIPGSGGHRGTEPTTSNRENPKPPPTPPPDTGVQKTSIEKLGDQFRELIRIEGLESTVTVSSNPGGTRLMLRLSESLLFGPGNAELTPQAKELIDKIAGILLKADKPVRVEGHTDNVPIHNSQFHSNWELSTARASSVIRYMIDNLGFAPERLSASGYGEFRPVAPNDTPEDRAKNRRVEFVVMDKDEDA